MKKLYTLLAAVLMAVSASAQVVLADPATGKEYGNGETMTLIAAIDPDWGELFLPAPLIKNLGNEKVNVRLDVNITELPAGTSVSDCFSGACTTHVATGSHTTANVAVGAGKAVESMIEWSPWNGNDNVIGTATIEFTIYENGNKGNVVTVKYVNPDPSAINAIEADIHKTDVAYNLCGQKVDSSAKGIVIINGKKVMK